MANTFSSLFYHVVFSTKNRKEFIKPDIEERVWSYIGGLAKDIGAEPVSVGGIDDHIHTLLMAKPKHSPSSLMQTIKGKSSKWMSSEFDRIPNFGWQDGYGVFSVSKSNVADVIDYIENQRQRHTGISFEDEYRRILKLHDLENVDERFILG